VPPMNLGSPTGYPRTPVVPLAIVVVLLTMVITGIGTASATQLAVAAQMATPLASAPDLPPMQPGEQRKVIQTAEGTVVIGHIPFGKQVRSATVCTGVVCLDIVGQSNFVSTWNTAAVNGAPTCTWADWLMNLQLVATTPVICAALPGVFYGYWSPSRTFPDGLACNTWFLLPGTPCAYIVK
jgi:hypothetical protein